MNIPGFVDLQVNGHLGVDFGGPDLTDERFAEAARQVLATGTAAFLPTLGTATMDVYEHCLPILARAVRCDEFRGRVPGIHIEGPFLSGEPGAVGAHNPDWVRPPDLDFLKRQLELADGTVVLLTVAPELEGADELARHAVSQGITVSLGHTLGRPEDFARLAAAGATALTHLANGAPNMMHRHHNPVWAGLANDDLTAMIITDGHHLPPAVIKSIVRAKGVERTVVVSDAAHLAGLPPGRYGTAEAEVVLEPSGRLHNPERQCLAGSSAVMIQCMNHLASLGILGLDDLIAVGLDNPLALIGLDRGVLRPVDEVAWDEEDREFRVKATARG